MSYPLRMTGKERDRMSSTRIILPKWCWDNAKDKQELKQNISSYLKRYPGYTIKEVGKYYAICDSNRF